MTLLTLAEVAQTQPVVERLHGAGFDTINAIEKACRFAKAAQRIQSETGDASATAEAWFVPGRIEVFGKHTDYAGGRSVVAAAQRGFCGVAVARDDAIVRIIDIAAGGAEAEFPMGPKIVPAVGCWSNYPMTVTRRLAANFRTVRRGATIAFSSDLPPAAGMSSSSALMVMTFLLLGQLNRVSEDPDFQANIRSFEDLSGYLGTVENGQTFKRLAGDRGVGTFGGSEDHTAILLSRPGKWAQYAYCPVRFERMITAPPAYRFVIAVSGIIAEKTGAAQELYNRASRRAGAVAQLLRNDSQRLGPNLAEILQTSPENLATLRSRLSSATHREFSAQELMDRFEHFATENDQIIPSIPDDVNDKGLRRVGDLARRSQQLGAEKLGNQIPETIFLATSATQLGAAAASAQGAGFGGSVWALVAEAEIDAFSERWSATYRSHFPAAADRAEFFATCAGPSATALSGHEIEFPEP